MGWRPREREREREKETHEHYRVLDPDRGRKLGYRGRYWTCKNNSRFRWSVPYTRLGKWLKVYGLLKKKKGIKTQTRIVGGRLRERERHA